MHFPKSKSTTGDFWPSSLWCWMQNEKSTTTTWGTDSQLTLWPRQALRYWLQFMSPELMGIQKLQVTRFQLNFLWVQCPLVDMTKHRLSHYFMNNIDVNQTNVCIYIYTLIYTYMCWICMVVMISYKCTMLHFIVRYCKCLCRIPYGNVAIWKCIFSSFSPLVWYPHRHMLPIAYASSDCSNL